ncbi:hypothetical protein [Euzebyella saccharophila]|uniref:Lipocalin-like domain-containing protein n=1 Tax=Euzebyella saccharophila TaxID=679664 RepID=A0ABV8JYG6_9FLAO|nr:hypothetical protein [Euzebyella saccharophila]
MMLKKMRFLIPFLVFVLILGCSEGINKEELNQLNGYWEIEKVTLPDGSVKEYSANTNVDFIYLEDLKGYRKKMSPNLQGSYKTTNDLEDFTILEKNGEFWMHYETELTQWSEKLMTLQKTSFSVVNEDGITYNYTRFEPISIPK